MGPCSMKWPINSSYECKHLPTYFTIFSLISSPRWNTWTYQKKKKHPKPKVLCQMKNCLMITVNLLRSKVLEDNLYFEFLSTFVLAVAIELTTYTAQWPQLVLAWISYDLNLRKDIFTFYKCISCMNYRMSLWLLSYQHSQQKLIHKCILGFGKQNHH